MFARVLVAQTLGVSPVQTLRRACTASTAHGCRKGRCGRDKGSSADVQTGGGASERRARHDHRRLSSSFCPTIPSPPVTIFDPTERPIVRRWPGHLMDATCSQPVLLSATQRHGTMRRIERPTSGSERPGGTLVHHQITFRGRDLGIRCLSGSIKRVKLGLNSIHRPFFPTRSRPTYRNRVSRFF